MAVSTVTEQLDSLYAATWVIRTNKKSIDQYFEAVPVWYFMNKRGRVKKVRGGRRIETSLRYAKNDTVTSLRKGGTVSINPTDAITVVYDEWKYIAGSVMRYMSDEQQNAGKAKITSKVDEDLDGLEMSITDEMAEQLHGDGTGNGSADINGLKNIIDTTPATGTVGNINAANYSWWRNGATNATGKSMSLYLDSYMRTAYNDTSKYGQNKTSSPANLVVCDQGTYEAYEANLMEIKRIVNKEAADASFESLSYKGKPIVWGPKVEDNTMRFLHTDYLRIVIDPAYWMKMTPWKEPENQPLDRVAQVISTLNLTCSNRRKQHVIYNLDTA